MEHYLSHTDYPIWEVIQKGNGPVSVLTDINGVIKVLPPKTAEEILARERERKVRTTLLMALPEDHLAKFHKMTDAKDMWDSIKSRFGGNDESKKMHKYILKQQFEGFFVSSLKMPIKSSLGLYLLPGPKVFEFDIKDSTKSSSSAQNVVFVSSESTNIHMSMLFNHGPHLDHEDLEQLDEFDLEEMDLKWQVAMISMRLKKFYKKSGRKLHFDAKEPVGFDKTKVECYNCHKKGHFARECRLKGNTRYKLKDNGRRLGKQEEPKALVTLDGEGVDWTDHAEDEQENFALMAYSNSGSDTEVTSCFKECMESYAKLKKLFDEQREQLGAASIEIQAYTQALKKVEAQVVTHLEKSTLFVPTAVLTRTGRILVNTASHNFNSQAVSTSAARTSLMLERPIVNENRPRNNFHKPHLPIRRPFNRTTAPRTKFSNQKVNTAEVKAVSAVGGKRETAVKPSAGLSTKSFKEQRDFESGLYPKHMTGNKAYLAEYQDFNGGPVAFGGSKGYITSKVSQMSDKKNKVLFTDSKCLVLSSEFKLPDANQVLQFQFREPCFFW
ncbi:ribonuclease H-like domain-containing protein, partial [Tanacetum coccineum]